MPTLLQVTNSASGGGIERLVGILADEATGRGWRSVVAYWRGDPPRAEATYVRMDPGRYVPRWPVQLARLVRQVRPAVVHLHGSAPGSLGAIAARVARRPAVPVIFSSYELHPTMPLAERFARRVAARLPAVTVAPSTAVAEALLVASVPRDRLRLVQLGTAVVAPLPPPEDEGVVRFVYVANFWPWKAHDVVLRAVSDLPARLDWELVLVGDGAERSAAEALARDAGIAHRVRFLGTLDDPWSAAAGSWAYVHPSRREALPLAILEAMMRGLPVVAAAAGGVPDVVRPGHTGILVPPGDVVALAAALRQLGESRSTRDALAGSARSFALERLRLDTWLDSLFSLYEGLIT